MLHSEVTLHSEVRATSPLPTVVAAARPVPRHVAIIMDGNGRWAKRAGLPRSEGHRAGAESVRAISRHARQLGVQALTLYAFSEQNWGRPAAEVHALFALLVDFLRSEREELHHNQIRLVAIGNTGKLPLPARLALQAVVAETAHYTGMTLALCLSYGGREDMVQATQLLARQVQAGELSPAAISADHISRALWTGRIGCDPDLVIRTSGEQRLSNFLLWDAAYAEFVFCAQDWPDFREQAFSDALQEYANRQRRFGVVAA
ncbi:MAG: di-trans,poly-cis-decaprenylcistransferase [Myxococcales bacterium]|nr:di-trans,poly-cis-decaprenylcistransferase [Myxococcales bacterium]